MSQLQRLAVFRRSPRLTLLTEVAVCSACIFAFLPPGLGAFPQRDEIAATDLEPRFQQRYA
jgi:hypothetical protein